MPIHIAPFFRSLEKNVLEPSGIYKTLDSLGYTVEVAEENAGNQGQPAPPSTLYKTVIYQGVSYSLTLP